jgi:hypothetical protein
MSQYNGDEVASDSEPGDVFGDEAGHDVRLTRIKAASVDLKLTGSASDQI